MTRFSILLFAVAAVTTDSCNQGSVDKLNKRVTGYYKALEEGRMGSEYWSQSYRRFMGDPEVAAKKHSQEIESILLLGPPIVTKSYNAASGQTLGHSTAYVRILGTKDRRDRRAKMITTWQWLRDGIGFYDWYLVRIDALVDVEDHEGPTGEAQDKGRVEHLRTAYLFG